MQNWTMGKRHGNWKIEIGKERRLETALAPDGQPLASSTAKFFYCSGFSSMGRPSHSKDHEQGVGDSCVWSFANRKGLGFAKDQFMRNARRIKNSGKKKAIRIFVLVSFGSILTEAGELRAQARSDAQERSDLTETSNAGGMRGKISGEFGIVDEESAIFPTILTFDERIRIYRRSFTEPESLIGPALGAGIGQLHNSPREWGQGAGGFGRR